MQTKIGGGQAFGIAYNQSFNYQNSSVRRNPFGYTVPGVRSGKTVKKYDRLTCSDIAKSQVNIANLMKLFIGGDLVLTSYCCSSPSRAWGRLSDRPVKTVIRVLFP